MALAPLLKCVFITCPQAEKKYSQTLFSTLQSHFERDSYACALALLHAQQFRALILIDLSGICHGYPVAAASWGQGKKRGEKKWGKNNNILGKKIKRVSKRMWGTPCRRSESSPLLYPWEEVLRFEFIPHNFPKMSLLFYYFFKKIRLRHRRHPFLGHAALLPD